MKQDIIITLISGDSVEGCIEQSGDGYVLHRMNRYSDGKKVGNTTDRPLNSAVGCFAVLVQQARTLGDLRKFSAKGGAPVRASIIEVANPIGYTFLQEMDERRAIAAVVIDNVMIKGTHISV